MLSISDDSLRCVPCPHTRHPVQESRAWFRLGARPDLPYTSGSLARRVPSLAIAFTIALATQAAGSKMQVNTELSRALNAAEDQPEIIESKRHSLIYRFIIRSHVARAFSDPHWNAEPIRHFFAGLQGSIPERGAGGIILAACTNLYYSSFAITLLLSLERQKTLQAVHLHLYRPSEATLAHIGRLRDGLQYVDLSWTIDQCELAQGLTYHTIYYASARLLIAAMLVETTHCPILCIDVDGIAVRPVWPQYAHAADQGDVGLIIRRAAKPWRKILASAVGVNPTPAGSRFISAAGRALCALYLRRPRYHLDQIVLHYAALQNARLPGKAQVFNMPRELSDHDFGQDAVIWTAKGWKAKTSDLYLSAKRDVDADFPDLALLPRFSTHPV